MSDTNSLVVVNVSPRALERMARAIIDLGERMLRKELVYREGGMNLDYENAVHSYPLDGRMIYERSPTVTSIRLSAEITFGVVKP